MKSINNKTNYTILPYRSVSGTLKIPTGYRSIRKLNEKNQNSECMDLLNNNSYGLSFKGSLSNASLELNSIFKLVDKKFAKYLTGALDNITQKTGQKYFKYDKKLNTVTVIPRKAFTFFKESITYPFMQMPFDLLNFGGDILKRFGLRGLHEAAFLKNYRKKSRLKRQADSLTGFFENINRIVAGNYSVLKSLGKEADDVKKILTNSTLKMFSDKTGHYDAAKERSLNRIVSGIIPAFFLANDAYNLSRLINDDKNEAQIEGKTRFRQELMRVFATAYFQLVLLGGFSKFVNKNKWASAGLSLGIVLFTETTSRLWNGKPVSFLSKEKVAQLNPKEAPKKGNNQKNSANDNPLLTKGNYTGIDVKLQQLPVQSWNKIQNNLFCQKLNTLENTATNESSVKKEKTNKKELFSMQTLGKWVASSIGVGVIATYVRKYNLPQKTYHAFTGFFKEMYTKLTTEASTISEQDFNSLIKNLDEFGFETQANLYKKAYKNKVKDGIIVLGTKDKKSKALINLAIGPFSFLWHSLAFPYKLFRLIFEVCEPKTKNFFSTESTNLRNKQINYEKAISVLNKKRSEFNNDEKFKKYLYENTLDAFNEISQSGVSNADLAKLVKIVSSGATSYFLIADNYNMVMQKSGGNNKKESVQKAKERAVQRISSLFYQMLLIDLFNSTFKKLYHSSLAGMSAVTSACTLCQELITRKAIGMPILPHSKNEITEIEEKNNNKKGVIGAYYRFMSQLTGKKQLSAINNKKIKNDQQLK